MDQGAKHRCDICGWKGWRQIWNLQCKTSWQIGKTTEKYPRYFIIFILITNIEQIFRTVETWFCHGHYSWLRLLWMNPLPTPVLQLQKCRLRRVSNQSIWDQPIWDQQGLLQCSSQNLISMRDLRCTHALDPSLMAVPAWYGFWSKTMLLCGARCGQCILLYFVIPLDTIFEIEGGGSYWNSFLDFFFPVGWANLLIFKIFQGSEAAVPILLVPKYIPGHTMWLLLNSLSHMVFFAHPLNLMSSYPPNLLPSSSPPLSGPESSFGPRILFF